MKRHDEDLWDFRSDPVFGDNKKNNTDSDSAQEQQTDEYRNILKSASESSSLDDIDNMTFVMKDGQASFIETSAKKTESNNKKQKSTKKTSSAKDNTPAKEDAYKDIELFKTPAAASAVAKEETKVDTTPEEKKATSKTTSDETKSDNTAEPEISKTELETSALEEITEASSEEVTATEEIAPKKEIIEEEQTMEETPEASEEITEEATEEVIEETENTDDNAVSEDTDSEKENTNDTSTNEDSEEVSEESTSDTSKSKFEGDVAIPKDILEGKKQKHSDSSTKQAPATDDDFILAKPHSKRRSHRSHSHSHHHSNHNNSEGTSIDSVEDYVFAHYHKQDGTHHHHHSHSSEKGSYTHSTENKETTVVRITTSQRSKNKKTDSPRARKWKARPWWQKLLIVLAWVLGIAAVLAIIAVILFLIFSRIGINQATSYEGVKITPPSYVEIEENGTVQIYKGKKYVLNTDIANILCIGVDKKDINSTLTYDEYGTLAENGQADALFMVALDTKTGKTTVLSIPRDTMADVNLYDKNGNWLGTDNLQICQSYAYGDGQESSCKNTLDAVQKLFYQLPIQTYFAMDLSAIAPLNDTVGGIKVTLKEDFYDSNLALHPKGKTMVLYGDHARKYLQYREVSKNASSIDRLDRQIGYLKLFTSRTLYMTKKDITTPISLFNIASENSITNMDVYRISGFARCLMENGVTDVEFKTIPGNSRQSDTVNENGEPYNEYHIDEEKFYELFLETYFSPVD